MIRRYVAPQPYLIGVDGWAPYFESIHCAMYDELICSDIIEFVKHDIDIWVDTVLCMDVLEHFERDEAKLLSDWLLEQPRAYMSTPMWDFKQGAVGGNEREQHRSHFEFDELVEWGWTPIAKVRWGDQDRKWIGAFRNARVDRGDERKSESVQGRDAEKV